MYKPSSVFIISAVCTPVGENGQVIDIPTYIRSLQNCGVFSTVSYTGYTADDNGYSIDLRCILAAPQ